MKFSHPVKFSHPAKILQAANFRNTTKFRMLRNFATCEIALSCATVHLSCFRLFDFFYHFLFVSPICSHCNSVCFVILVICKGGLAIKALEKRL